MSITSKIALAGLCTTTILGSILYKTTSENYQSRKQEIAEHRHSLIEQGCRQGRLDTLEKSTNADKWDAVFLQPLKGKATRFKALDDSAKAHTLTKVLYGAHQNSWMLKDGILVAQKNIR